MKTTQKTKGYKYNAFQKRWLKALETGEFKQARDQLCKVRGESESYCCLGVACELYNRRKDVKKLEVVTEGSDKYYSGYQSDLPHSVCRDLKLKTNLGALENSDGKFKYRSLADMNDKGCTHRYIAKFIREHPEAVFENAQ